MAATGAIHCQLWMGGLESYMNETFVKTAFQKLGEDPQSVKIMRNKYSGEPAGYCFVHFITDEAALNAMHKLNGKVIPNSNPPVRFKLNHASTTGRPPQDREFSLWVGDLSSDVDDYTLYRTFASKYPSIRTAKVILDASGFSKGYGFIRFAQEDEQKRCLTEMNGHTGLGTKAIKISNAVPKPHRYHSPSNSDILSFASESLNVKSMSAHIPENCSAGTTTHAVTTPTGSTAPATPTGTVAVGSTATATPASTDYSQPQQQYYDPYWQNYGAWQGYHQGYYDPNVYGQGAVATGTSVANGASDGSAHVPPTSMDYSQHSQQHMVDPAPPVTVSNEEALAREEEDMELVEHDVPVDVEKMNKELCDRDYLLWDAIESSKWLPVECLEC